MSDFRVGDRVRVTFEATVVGSPAPRGACLCSYGHNGTNIREEYLRQKGVEVEVIEPPAEVFKPGEVVIRKHDDAPILLTDMGYVYLRGAARGNSYTYDGTGYSRDYFSSTRFYRAEGYRL